MLSNTHFSIAVHVLSALAYNDGAVVGSDDLARTVGTNPSFLRGLIGQLKQAGLVETQMGKGGGTRLSKPASRITLHDVYRATGEQPGIKTHPCDASTPCPVAQAMTDLMGSVNDRIEHVVEEELKSMTVADLVSEFIGRPA